MFGGCCSCDYSESSFTNVIDEIIDEMVLGLCFEIHRASKKNFIFLDEMDVESQKRYEILDTKGCDVFGASAHFKKQHECVCPNCMRTVAASRFAPHLGKCLEMTQDAVKVANKRPSFKTERSEADEDERFNKWKFLKIKKCRKMKVQLFKRKSYF